MSKAGTSPANMRAAAPDMVSTGRDTPENPVASAPGTNEPGAAGPAAPVVATADGDGSPAALPGEAAGSLAMAPWDIPRPRGRSDGSRGTFSSRSNGAWRPLRAALAQRDLAGAELQLKHAARTAATYEARADVQRLWLVFNQLSRFWAAVGRSIQSVRPGDKLRYRGIEVVVQARQDRTVTLLAANGDQKSFSLDVSTIDPDLAYSLAQRQLVAAGPVFWGMAGTFWTVDDQGDAHQGRQLLAMAYQQGVPVQPLLPELGEPKRTATPPRSTQAKPAATSPAADTDSGAAKKQPVPRRADQTQALRKIRSLYKVQYAQTRDPEAGVELARQLLERGLSTQDDPVTRYVLLAEAIGVATRVVDPEIALRGLDAMGREYAVDVSKKRPRLLSSLFRSATTDEKRRELLDTTMLLADELVDQDDYEQAILCLAVAYSALRKASAPERLKWLTRRRARIQYIRQQHEKTRDAIRTLAADPGSADANLAVGKFFCFAKGDFARGLPLLAKGSDDTLRQIARQDLAHPEAGEARLQLADAWWDLAGKLGSHAQPAVLEHARGWYALAYPDSKGLDRARIERRLKQLEQDRGVPAPTIERFVQGLIARTWKIEWENGRTWQQLRFFADHRWGYHNSVAGTWSVNGGSIVAPMRKNPPKQSLVFRLDGRVLRATYLVEGNRPLQGVVVPE